MQSSSATTAIILTTLNAGIIGFDSATAMVIGANVGTTVTILLGSIGGAQVKKRVAYSHFAFNMITGILALILLPVLVYIVRLFINTSDNAVIGLALFHTIFNIVRGGGVLSPNSCVFKIACQIISRPKNYHYLVYQQRYD